MSIQLHTFPIGDSVTTMHTKPAREYVAAETRAALARDGRTATQLATDTGISKSSLSKKLRGQVSFSVEELVSVAVALSIDPGTLVPPTAQAAA